MNGKQARPLERIRPLSEEGDNTTVTQARTINRSVTNRVLGRIDGGYRIALTCGANSDWVRDVLAAGGCQIETRRKRITLTQPHAWSDPRRSWAPPFVRQVLRVAGASQYMQRAVADAPHGNVTDAL